MTPRPTAPALAASRLQAAAARIDITPPVGMYHRMWGAAATDVSSGVHRPLTATLLALRAAPETPPALLVSLDWCVAPPGDELDDLLAPLIAQVDGDPARVIVACSHTHGAGYFTRRRHDLPGGARIGPYLDGVRDQLAAAAAPLLAATAAPDAACTATWAYGRCDLATNRDLPDPDAPRLITGWNPAGLADDTLLVGRFTRDADAAPLATLVNYACHPTTLAWENTLVSPDYIGAMRELVEGHSAGAPVLFLQGASGELAPAHQYSGDTTLADTHGRRLGHAVLATLAGMLPPGQQLAYTGVMESGAPLAVWRARDVPLGRGLDLRRRLVQVPLKPLPSPAEIKAKLAAETNRFQAERLRRKLQQVEVFGTGPTHDLPVWDWRLGPLRLIATPAEPYSHLQTRLRAASSTPVAVANVANGWSGYLPPAELYDADLYTVWQTPFDRGSLEAVITGLLT